MMRWIRNLWFRLRATFAPGRMEREMDEEMRFHLEMEARKLTRAGMTPEEAAGQAMRRFGDPMRERERARAAWGIALVQDFRADARQTFRSLRRNPVFAVVAVFTLALGIGGFSAVFSVVNGVLLKPLPYRDSGRLVSVLHSDNIAAYDAYPLSPALYFTFRDHARALEEIGLYRETRVTVTGIDRPERVDALAVTDGLFTVLGIQPLLGRWYTREDVSPGSTLPVILAHGFWQSRFGGDPDILGQTLRIDGNELPIVGVMPPDLHLPGVGAELFLPLVFDRARIGIGNFSFPGIGRLAPDATLEEATRELDGLTETAGAEWGGIPLAELRARDFTSLVRPLQDIVVGGAGKVLWVVFGTVGLVLLVACANVANLFLVRAETRQRDLALRTAIGASRARLARQCFTESLLVGLLGGAFGLLLAIGGIRLLLSLAPSGIPRLDNVELDPAVLLFALAISVFTGLFFGSLSGLGRRSGSLIESLQVGGRGSGRGSFRLRIVFAVSQVALALVLLVASGLMIRSFQALRSVPPGFQDPEQVLTFRLSVPPTEVPDLDEAVLAFQTVLDRLNELPGVTSASGAASVAMEDWESWDDWMVEDFPRAEGEVRASNRINWLVPGYHETLRNRLLAGRSLEWADIHDRRNVALVTENFAREYWGEPEAALGKRIRNNPSSPWREIVGVVGNMHTRGVAAPAPLMVYLPFVTADFWGVRSFCVRELRLVVRTDRARLLSLLPEVRQAVWSVDPDLALADVRTLDRIFAESISRTSFTLVMLVVAAGVALILGVVGVYGVISYIVSQRTREMGVRMALGASGYRVTFMILGQGAVIAASGAGLGVAVAFGLTRVMSALLFEVRPVDLPTYAVVSLLLATAVFLASYVPARRAASVNPAETLKKE